MKTNYFRFFIYSALGFTFLHSPLQAEIEEHDAEKFGYPKECQKTKLEIEDMGFTEEIRNFMVKVTCEIKLKNSADGSSLTEAYVTGLGAAQNKKVLDMKTGNPPLDPNTSFEVFTKFKIEENYPGSNAIKVKSTAESRFLVVTAPVADKVFQYKSRSHKLETQNDAEFTRNIMKSIKTTTIDAPKNTMIVTFKSYLGMVTPTKFGIKIPESLWVGQVKEELTKGFSSDVKIHLSLLYEIF
jgi:hypothetical protein